MGFSLVVRLALMAADPMAGAWAKYHWARKHVEAMEPILERSIDSEIQTVGVDVEVKESLHLGDCCLPRISQVPSLPPDLGLQLGDTFHNFPLCARPPRLGSRESGE